MLLRADREHKQLNGKFNEHHLPPSPNVARLFKTYGSLIPWLFVPSPSSMCPFSCFWAAIVGRNPMVSASNTLFTLWLLPALGFCWLPSLSFFPHHQPTILYISFSNSPRFVLKPFVSWLLSWWAKPQSTLWVFEWLVGGLPYSTERGRPPIS